ncbi:hypothetical protein PENSPDRAFT_651480 [Peniophora sp. CONT]|nr:hypothetical protein PENSPDRAFT_651480 [Peniophora sp. CONT]
MDLPVIGAHCSLLTCNELDLLPLICVCSQRFCKKHIAADAHECPVDRSAASASAVSHPALKRCAVTSCGKPSLEAFIQDSSDTTNRIPALCSRCKLAFCVSHREPASHFCPAPSEEEVAQASLKRKNEAAHAVLARRFPTSSAVTGASKPKPKAKVPTDPKKRAALRKIEVMKLRQHALPVDAKASSSIPPEDRLFFKARTANSEKDRLSWIRKSTGTGRALDLLASHFGMTATDTRPLQLVKIDDAPDVEPQVLRNDLSLSEQLTDGDVVLVEVLSSITAGR